MTALDALFATHFGPGSPTFVVTAPGRVNLIGDHIDYAGLPVLPMALQHRVTVLARPRDDRTVRLVNTDPAFAPREYRLDPDVSPWPPGDWGNYAKAATCHLERRYGTLRGFDAAFTSALPIASGLSSSSALVVAGALCATSAAGLEVSTLELAEELADAERYVGTRGGGMDQAICLGAVARTASRVEFAPLRLTAVPVPGEWRFLVASSLVQAEKSAGTREAYNARRRDAERALTVLAEQRGRGADRLSYRALVAETEPSRLAELAESIADPVLRRRFRHVVTEGARVGLAEAAMRRGDLADFGTLMVASHRSLRDDFEVSCAELDVIVEIACAAGAAGARLTGAGFGGCVVILCHADRVRQLMLTLTDQFYAGRGASDALEQVLFVAAPSAGAAVTETVEVS